MRPRVWVEGQRVEDGHLRVAAGDDGLLLGRAVFESLRVDDLRPFRLEAHLARLESSGAALGVPLPPRARWRAWVSLALDDAPAPTFALRLHATAGGLCFLRAAPAPALPAAAVAWARVLHQPLLAAAKHAARGPWEALAAAAGAHDVVFCDAQGAFVEAGRSAALGVVGGAVHLAPDDGRRLPSITAAALREVAAGAGIPWVDAPVPWPGGVDELFGASALRGVFAVERVDGAPAPGLGPVGTALAAGLSDLRRRG